METSQIVPVLKKRDKKVKFRVITLHYLECFERYVYSHINKFLIHLQINRNQHGFLRNRSSVTQPRAFQHDRSRCNIRQISRGRCVIDKLFQDMFLTKD